LETALCGVPQVVCYRANGAKISYDIMKRLLSVSHVALPNLIAGKEIIPEQLVHLCTPDLVATALAPLLREGSAEREAQLAGYARMRRVLGSSEASVKTAEAIVNDLRNKR
ncbi:MAG: sugar synthetase, partial [Muribaculaceae bacterium]|nr:sugar synthetase [Muribaculaceae bacterium]